MKRIVPIILIFCFYHSNAQYCAKSYSDPAFQQFLKTETWVLYTGDEEFDTLLSRSLAKFWKVTPYKLATSADIKKHQHDSKLSFMMPLDYSYVTHMAHYDHSLSVIIGGEQNCKVIAYANYDNTAFGPSSQEQEIAAMLGIKFRLKDVIATMNHAIEMTRDDKIEYNGDIEKFVNANFYNKDAVELKTKTLYIKKQDVSGADKIVKTYPYKCKVVNFDDYFAAVENEQKDIVYLLLTHSPAGIVLIDPSSHKCVGSIPYKEVTTIDAGDLKSVAKLVDDAGKGK